MNIPFEAFDFELNHQEINIPDGFEAIIKDNKIILKRKESEDERMVKFIKNQLFNIKKTITKDYELDVKITKAIDWLEKQVTWKKALIDAKKYEAVSITHFIDRSTQSGFLTNTECKDLLDAVINDDWQKVYDYMKKKLEKQDTYETEKLNVLKFLKKETGCGLAEVNDALLKLIKVLKEQPMAHELKIEWEPLNDNIITRDDEILQAISVGLNDVMEDAGWSDFGGIPIEEILDWIDKRS